MFLKFLLPAAGVLESVLADANLREDLARRFTDQIADVVAEYQLNKALFKSPGAIRYRLEVGAWPTDKPITTIEQHQRRGALVETRRRQQEAEKSKQQREAFEVVERERLFGAQFDAMTSEEQEALASSVLSREDFEAWQQWPGIYRDDLLCSAQKITGMSLRN